MINNQGHVSYSALVLFSSRNQRDVTVPKYVQTPNSISNTRYQVHFPRLRDYSSAVPHDPDRHIFTDLTVIPLESPSPHVGSH